MRITIDDEILDTILEDYKCDEKIHNHIKNAIALAKKYNSNSNKKEAMKKTNEMRKQKTKDKIQNAINMLRLEGKKINAYQVTKSTGLNYNTVHKYFKEFDL